MPIDIGSGYTVLTRAEWGATVSPGYPRPGPISEGWVHHTVTIAHDDHDLDKYDDITRCMLEIEQIGLDRFGCYPYSFNFHPSGAIAEGCGWDYKGAHTEDHNTISFALSAIGNYETSQPTQSMLGAMAQVIKWGKRIGRLSQNLELPTGGHRDVKQTACPGNFLYSQIPLINQLSHNPDKLVVGGNMLSSTTVDPTGTFHEVVIGTNKEVFHRYATTPEAIRDKPAQENLGGQAIDVESYWVGNDFWIKIVGLDGKPWYKKYDNSDARWGNWYQGSGVTILH